MTLRQLAVFVAVAREGTVTRAAEAIRLTQSAASMALSDLESGLGTALFDRQGKRLQLNELGRYLLPRAVDILSRCEAFEQAARAEEQPITLSLGATLTIADYQIPTLMADFLHLEPQANLQLQVGNTRQIIDAVSQFQVDLGLIEGSCHHAQLESTLWKMDELVVFCAANHWLAHSQPAQAGDLASIPWVVREAGSGTREVFDRVILADLPNAAIRLALGHTEALLRVVEQGIGVGCVSRLAVQPKLDQGQLVIIPTPFWQLSRPLSFIVHRQKYQSPGLTKFINFCTEQTPHGLTA